jgi:hypothetical protein
VLAIFANRPRSSGWFRSGPSRTIWTDARRYMGLELLNRALIVLPTGPPRRHRNPSTRYINADLGGDRLLTIPCTRLLYRRS